MPERGGTRARRGDPRRQAANPTLPGLFPPDRGRPAAVLDLPRPPPRSSHRLRGRTIARPDGPGKGGRPSTVSTTSCSAASRPYSGMGPEQLTIDALVARVHSGAIRELIMATNPNLEGDGTALSDRQPPRPIRPANHPAGSRSGLRRHARNSPIATCSPTPSPDDSHSNRVSFPTRLLVRAPSLWHNSC